MRNQTLRTRGGAIIQAGIGAVARGTRLPMTPRFSLYRALVLNTFIPRESDGQDLVATRRPQSVECDVLMVRNHVLLPRAVVQQPVFGVNNAEPWIPKPATRTIDGVPLNFDVKANDGSFNELATSLDNTNGDMVYVQFVEGDVNYPVITGAVPHERTNRTIRAGNGWSEDNNDRGYMYSEEKYIHHQGTEVRINKSGDVLIDTVGAYSDDATEDNSAAGGDVRVRLKEGQRFTIALGNDDDVFEVFKEGNQLRVDIGEDSAERLVLGDGFRTFLNQFLTDEYYLHTHPTGVGPSGTPIQQNGTQMSEDLLSEVGKTKKS